MDLDTITEFRDAPGASWQPGDAWLGGGEKSGLAKILQATAVFLKEQKKISDVLPSYAAFVTPDVVIAVEKGAGS